VVKFTTLSSKQPNKLVSPLHYQHTPLPFSNSWIKRWHSTGQVEQVADRTVH